MVFVCLCVYVYDYLHANKQHKGRNMYKTHINDVTFLLFFTSMALQMLEASLYVAEHLPDGASGLWGLLHCESFSALGELEWIPFPVLRKALDVNVLGKVFFLKHLTVLKVFTFTLITQKEHHG